MRGGATPGAAPPHAYKGTAPRRGRRQGGRCRGRRIPAGPRGNRFRGTEEAHHHAQRLHVSRKARPRGVPRPPRGALPAPGDAAAAGHTRGHGHARHLRGLGRGRQGKPHLRPRGGPRPARLFRPHHERPGGLREPPAVHDALLEPPGAARHDDDLRPFVLRRAVAQLRRGRAPAGRPQARPRAQARHRPARRGAHPRAPQERRRLRAPALRRRLAHRALLPAHRPRDAGGAPHESFERRGELVEG